MNTEATFDYQKCVSVLQDTADAQEALIYAERQLVYTMDFDFILPDVWAIRDKLVESIGISATTSTSPHIPAEAAKNAWYHAHKELSKLCEVPLVLQFGADHVVQTAVLDALNQNRVVLPQAVFEANFTATEQTALAIQRQYLEALSLAEAPPMGPPVSSAPIVPAFT
jgi:hypothetical protein